MATYDKYYKENQQYFGKPNKELIAFFSDQKNKGSVVDLGAGQGRNSLPLYDMGYDVTAVDISKEGLKQIKDINPDIKTLLDDIYTFDISNFDYILMDSMLHFYKKEYEKEKAFVINILNSMKITSVFVNCMIYSKHKVLLDIISSDSRFQILHNQKFMYNTSWKYHMITAKKISL